MIIRDAHHIIVQHDYRNLTNPPDAASGGDSLARTGPMALAGSEIDKQVLQMFVLSDGQLVRHPIQESFSNPAETSRDQVVQGVVADLDSIRTSALYYAEKGWVNKDYLSPEVRYYLYKIAKKEPPLWVKLLAPFNLILSILWNTIIAPHEEQNQFLCVLTQYPGVFMKLYAMLHPSVDQNLSEYWNGWRDMPEVAEACKKIVKNKLKDG